MIIKTFDVYDAKSKELFKLFLASFKQYATKNLTIYSISEQIDLFEQAIHKALMAFPMPENQTHHPNYISWLWSLNAMGIILPV